MKEAPEKPPYISEELIKWLDYMFKDICPGLEYDLDAIRFKSGQIHVVRHLKSLKAAQDKNILKA